MLLGTWCDTNDGDGGDGGEGMEVIGERYSRQCIFSIYVTVLTHMLPGASLWRVKQDGVNQSIALKSLYTGMRINNVFSTL